MAHHAAVVALATVGIVVGLAAGLGRGGDGASGVPQVLGVVPTEDSLVEAGRRWFKRYDCLHCHSLAGHGGQMGPELLGVAERRSSEWLVRHFLNPDSVTPTTLMPAFGPESVAVALTALMRALRTAADAESLIRPFVEGARRLRTLPASVIDGTLLADGSRLLLRLTAGDSLRAICLEDQHREANVLVLRREWYEPREEGTGWRRFMDDRVYLEGRTLVLDSAHTVMDGVVHHVQRVDDLVTLHATRPGTSRGWTETRRLPQPLYGPSDHIVAAVRLSPGDSAAYWVFGEHGGAHPRIVTAATTGLSDVVLMRVVTAGTRSADRWVRVRGGRLLFTTYGSTPDGESRLVPADDAAALRWLAALRADSRRDWVRAVSSSLLDTWPHR
jgi:hypothetical protein